MFSRSKRFTQKVPATPAVGQYDVRLGSKQSGAVLFPKDKRFKEQAPAGNDDTSLLDISNCSSVSVKSSGSIKSDHSVFATPGKPVRKANNLPSSLLKSACKNCKSIQLDTQDENKDDLATNISKLQDEVEQLRSENEMLQKIQHDGSDESTEDLKARIDALVKDVERLRSENHILTTKLGDMESAAHKRQSLESNHVVLKEEVTKLREEIEKEIARSKIEQSNHECVVENLKTDLDLASRKSSVLQEQIKSLEQQNTDMSESRDDIENQCSKLHGLTINLQEQNIALQIRLEEVEDAYQVVSASREKVDIQLNSCKAEHKTRAHQLECALSEKMSAMLELNEEKASLQENVAVCKNRVEELQQRLVETVEADERTREEMRIVSEERDASLVAIRELNETHEQVLRSKDQETSELRDDTHRLEDELEKMGKILFEVRGEKRIVSEERDASLVTIRELNEKHEQVLRLKDQETSELRDDTHRLEDELEKMGKILFEVRGEKRIVSEERDASLVAIRELNEKHEQVLRSKDQETSELRDDTHRLEDELEKMGKILFEVRGEKRDACAAEEKTAKLKQEFGKRLVETQKKLSQKEIELESFKKEFEDHISNCCSEESWKKKYEDLTERISPFQEQLDAYEFEKQNLLSRNSESQNEIDKLSQQYAKLLGHQNQKQKIRHVMKLKEENIDLKKEVVKLREQCTKQKLLTKRMEENANKATVVRRFDPSLAFQHSNGQENKENTQLKTRCTK